MRKLVSRNLEGSISTPGLGSLPPPNYHKKIHEFTAIIQLPNNIVDVLGNDSLMVDVSVTIPKNQPESGVDFWKGAELEYNHRGMTWIQAEASCVSKGGHLAAAPSISHLWKLWKLGKKKNMNGKVSLRC